MLTFTAATYRDRRISLVLTAIVECAVPAELQRLSLVIQGPRMIALGQKKRSLPYSLNLGARRARCSLPRLRAGPYPVGGSPTHRDVLAGVVCDRRVF